jgi:hypothetical protein
MSYIFIIVFVILELTYLGRIIINPSEVPDSLIMSALFFSGLVNIIFGSSVIKLKQSLGGTATRAGVFRIILGVFSLIILTYMIVPFLKLLVGIMEAILFFKASKSIQ